MGRCGSDPLQVSLLLYITSISSRQSTHTTCMWSPHNNTNRHTSYRTTYSTTYAAVSSIYLDTHVFTQYDALQSNMLCCRNNSCFLCLGKRDGSCGITNNAPDVTSQDASSGNRAVVVSRGSIYKQECAQRGLRADPSIMLLAL